MGGCFSSSSTDSSDHPPIPLEPLRPRSNLPPRQNNDQTLTPSTTTAVPTPSSEAPNPQESAITTRPSVSHSSSRFSLGSLRRLSSTKASSSTMSRPPLNALRQYATLPHPQSSIPASVLLFANPQCIAIFDAYPKAKYHFLVLPRYPFPSQADIESKRSIVKLEHLDDLKSFLLKPSRNVREEVFQAMLNTARDVEEMIRDEMVKTEGFEWKIDVGFHAIPSMKHLHLHVISEDRISPAMKTKKHHNSFRPDLGFFLDVMEVQRWVQMDEEFLHERVDALSGTTSLLDSTLTCFKCDEPFSNMAKLKAHQEKKWNREKKAALKRIRRTGRQNRSSDEDDLF